METNGRELFTPDAIMNSLIWLRGHRRAAERYFPAFTTNERETDRAKSLILSHGLHHPMGEVWADAYERYEGDYHDLDGRIATIKEASFTELMPLFRARKLPESGMLSNKETLAATVPTPTNTRLRRG
jgi:hypothetical protein